EQPVHAVGAEHVRDLVRVGHDRRRPERQHESSELVHQQLRRLEMHVGIDEPRHDVTAGRAARLVPFVLTGPGDVAVHRVDVCSHSRVKTEKPLPPGITRSAGSSPRATARRRERAEAIGQEPYSSRMDVLTPRSLAEALQMRADHPEALAIQGGTDVMVAVNFDRARPPQALNLNEVAELRGWSRENGALRLGAGLTYSEAMRTELADLLPALAEASRTVGSPQIRNRGTIGGNLATASPAGDALPPLVIEGAEVECASVRGTRSV